MSENYENKNLGNENEESEYLFDLFDDEGNKETFEHLDTVQVDGKDYVICIPYVEEEEEDEISEVLILRMEPDGESGSVLVPEEDESILDTAYDIFRERNEDLFDWED